MGYYQELRKALDSTKMGDTSSKEYKIVMEAKKPLLDILFYDSRETGEPIINKKAISHIGYWGHPTLVKKVYSQIMKYTNVFDTKCTKYPKGYVSQMTMEFRCSLLKKCGILLFIEDDFVPSAYAYHFNDDWGTPFRYYNLTKKFYRIYLVEYSKRTGEGFYQTTLHNPKKLIEDLNEPVYDRFNEYKEDMITTIKEAAGYLVDYKVN